MARPNNTSILLKQSINYDYKGREIKLWLRGDELGRFQYGIDSNYALARKISTEINLIEGQELKMGGTAI